jgi:hypothetical protein
LGFTSKEQFLSLRKLKPGEFFAFGPAISDEVQQVTIGPVTTSHPKAGSRSLTNVVPPTAAIKKLLGKLADLPQEAAKKAQTIDDLRREIRTLKSYRCPTVVSSEQIDAAVAKAIAKERLVAERQAERFLGAIRQIGAIVGKFNEEKIGLDHRAGHLA